MCNNWKYSSLNMNDMEPIIGQLRAALVAGDRAAVERHKERLLGETARALQAQNRDALARLNAAFADLAPLADHYDEGEAGDTWRHLGRILRGLVRAGFPLRDLLAVRGTLAERLLEWIAAEPGIRPGTLAERAGKSRSHISNTLRRLEERGLILRLGRGRAMRLHPSPTAREMLAATGQGAARSGETTPEPVARVIQIADFKGDPRRLPERRDRVPALGAAS